MGSFEGFAIFYYLNSFGLNSSLHFPHVNTALNSNGLLLQGANGILVPGGFGDRGVQGKILAAKYARENSVPFLGICLGMQIAVIEFARSVLGLHDANSTEFDPEAKNPCVIFMPEVYCLIISFYFNDNILPFRN